MKPLPFGDKYKDSIALHVLLVDHHDGKFLSTMERSMVFVYVGLYSMVVNDFHWSIDGIVAMVHRWASGDTSLTLYKEENPPVFWSNALPKTRSTAYPAQHVTYMTLVIYVTHVTWR